MDQLRGPAATTKIELLGRSQSYGTGLASVGFWCPLILSLECLTCGGGRVVIWHSLKLFTVCTDTEDKRSATSCTLSGATWHQLQSDQHMAITCTGLRCAQGRASCKPRPAAINAGPGATLQEVQSMQRLDAACLRDFREVQSMSQGRLFFGKASGKDLGGLTI